MLVLVLGKAEKFKGAGEQIFYIEIKDEDESTAG